MLMITETKISDEAYCHNWIGYDMVCLPAASTEAGGTGGSGPGLLRETKYMEHGVDALPRA